MAKEKKDREEKEEDLRLVPGPFGPRIFVPYKKDIVHKSEYLPPGHLSISIVGRSGCGKSTLVLSIVPQINNLSQVIYLSLVEENPVYIGVKQYCKANDIEFGFASEPNSAMTLINEFKERKNPETQGVIIIDDFNVQKSGRNDTFNNLNAIVSAVFRNHGYHNIFVTQSSTNVPTLLRANSSIKIVFGFAETHALRSIRNDFLSSGAIKTREDFDSLFNVIQNEPHAWIMLDSKRNRVFISMGSDNSPVQEVEFMGDSKDPIEQILQDEGVKQRRKAYDELKSKAKNRLDNLEIAKKRTDLKAYLVYLSKNYKLKKSDQNELIHQVL